LLYDSSKGGGVYAGMNGQVAQTFIIKKDMASGEICMWTVIARKIDSFYHRCSPGILSAFWLFSAFSTSAQTIRFQDVTLEMKARGWLVNGVSAYGHTGVFSDISGDSLPDLYIASAVRQANGKVPETLYISHAGSAYTEEDALRGVSDSYGMTGSHGVIFVDYDNDGDLDIFNATTDDRIRLYRNRGDGYFVDYTDAAKMVPIKVKYDTYGYIGYGTRGLVAFDADNDGDMDLLGVNWGPVENFYEVPWETPPQPNEFFINNGDGTMTRDDTRGLSPINPSNEGTQGVTAIDIDNDGDVDVFVCHRNYAFLGYDSEGNKMFGRGATPCPNDLFINNGSGQFTQVDPRERGLYSESNDVDGVTFADYDNDGDLDAFVVYTSLDRPYIRVLQNDGNGYFHNVSATVIVYQYGFTCFLFDADNDGDLDIFAPSTRATAKFYQNDGTGKYTELSGTGLNIAAYDPRGGSIADIDNDGLLDIYYADANKDANPLYSNRLLRNQTITTNRWVKIWGRGPKGDLGALGTKIWVFDKGYMEDMSHLVGYKQIISAYGYLAQDDIVQHFGIGLRDSVDVKIKMLDGTTLKTRLPAKMKFFFSRPSQLLKLDGDNQTSEAGKTLASPLRVAIKDAQGKAVMGVPVSFEVISGDGHMVQTSPVYTNGAGIAVVQYVAGMQAGTHRIRAVCPYLINQIEFSVTVLSSGPVALQLLSGGDQSAYSGSVLPDSIRVRVVTGGGDGQPNHPVTFEVIAGNGRLKPGDALVLERLTNADGIATVAWQLGAVPGDAQRLRITAFANNQALTGSPLLVNATALQRPVVSGRPFDLLYVDGNNQTGTAGRLLDNPFVVMLIDSIGRPCPHYDVEFLVTQGGGSLNNGDQWISQTDYDGKASAQLRLGVLAGVSNNQVKAVHSGVGDEVLFTASAVADTPAVLIKKVEGDGQVGKISQSLPKPLRVQVTDVYGNAIPGLPVHFDVTLGDSKVNDGASAIVVTDASGHAQAIVKLGATPGNTVVTVTATYQDRNLSGSPALFTAIGVSFPAYLHLTSADSTSGVAGQPMREPLRVRVTDELGYPIPNQPVTFLVRRGGGTFENQTQILKLTDLNGAVSVVPTLGPSVGPYNNVFEVQSFKEAGQNLLGSPLHVYVSAKKSLAAQMVRVSGDGLSVQAGNYLPQPLAVRIVDAASQPVAGHEVMFEVIKGSGRLGNGQTGKVTIQTGSDGLAQVSYRVGPEIGNDAHIVRASSDDGIQPLINSPTTFKASCPYGQVDTLRSKITASTPVIANGIDESVVTIRLVDAQNNPVPNERITLLTTGNSNRVTQPEGPTDASGETFALVRSTLAEKKQLRAYVVDEQKFLASSAEAEFVPGPPARIYLEAGDYQNGVLNSILDQSLKIRVFDLNDNLVPNASVYFTPLPGCGRVEPAMTQKSDAAGQAGVNWILGPTIGIQQLQVRVTGLAATALFTAYAATPGEMTLTKNKGDGQFAMPGAIFPDSLTVKVINGHQTPIFGLDVTFSVLQGDATISGALSTKTDVYGLARTRLSAGATTGVVRIRAAVDANHSVDFDCAVSNSLPEKMELVYGNGLSAPVGGSVYPLSVLVTDLSRMPVANVPVQFTCETTGGTVVDPQPLRTNNDGVVAATVRLGSSAGDYLFSAANVSLSGSPVRFRLTAIPGAPYSISVFDGNNQSARAVQFLLSPVQVRLADVFGNGVANQQVNFVVTSGGGEVQTLQAMTDAAGIASARWKLGLTGTQELQAVASVLPGKAAVFTAVLIENVPPVISAPSDTVVQETQPLVFAAEAVDPEGGAVELSAMNLPSGASFDPINTRLFIWRPGFDQAGVYVVIFKARDLNGGETQKTITIHVTNLNRPPVIYSFIPEFFYLSTPSFKPQVFAIKASDQDGDLLRYSWRVDGRVVGHSDTLTILPTPTMPAQFTVSAMVRDASDSVSQDWMVKLQTRVQLSSFQVASERGRNQLSWLCTADPSTLGFNVLRAESRQGPFVKINVELIRPGPAEEYGYEDRPANTAISYFYQLQALDVDGTLQMFGPVEASPQIPTQSRLTQNYPNPFNPETTVQFELARPQSITLSIYNLSGQLVRTLHQGRTEAGYHRVVWDGRDQSGRLVVSGIYYALLQGEEFRSSIKLVMLK